MRKLLLLLSMTLMCFLVVYGQYIKRGVRQVVIPYSKPTDLPGGFPGSFLPIKEIDKEAVGSWGKINNGLQMRIVGFYDINTPCEHFVLEIRNIANVNKNVVVDINNYDSNGAVIGRHRLKHEAPVPPSQEKRMKMLYSPSQFKRLYSTILIKPKSSLFIVKKYRLFYLNNFSPDECTFIYKIPKALMDKYKKEVAIEPVTLEASITLPKIKLDRDKKTGLFVVDKRFVGPAIFQHKKFIDYMNKSIRNNKLKVFTPPTVKR